jgi:exonuclease SbcD
MRFIHTADWHLGRLFHGVHLTQDQAHILEQFLALLRDAKPDAVIVAGDVFDRAVPPPDAVALLDSVLSEIVLDLKIPAIIIAGNHDSSHRLQFGSRLLAEEQLFVFGVLPDEIPVVNLSDSWGPVQFAAIPYSEPSVVRETLGLESVGNHQAAFEHLLAGLSARLDPKCRRVVIAHAFVGDSVPSESERPLSVGGFDRVAAELFQDFHYTALGHLHRPQPAGQPHIAYSGSLLKYSFSESDHEKGVHLVEMDENGSCKLEKIHLTPRRDVRRVEGMLREILNGPQSGENVEDYLCVALLDTDPILDAMGKLREVYPNVLHIERPFFDLQNSSVSDRLDHRKLNDMDLFAAFFRQVTGVDLSSEQRVAYATTVDDLRKLDREGFEQ